MRWLRFVACLFVFIFLLSQLSYAQQNCSDSERKCVEWRTSWSQENRVKIETPEYKACMQKLERQNLIQQCLNELFECQEMSNSLFYDCVRDKHNNDTCPCTVSSNSVSCTYTNGTVNCADCVAESEQVKTCSKNSMEKYGWVGSEYSCNNSGGAGVASCDQWLQYNVSPSQEITECTRYECPQVSGSAIAPCASREHGTCDRSNVTKYADVTYIFDRGYNVTMSEPYTFEKVECYTLIQEFGGENCSEVINTTRSGPTTTKGEPVPIGTKVVQCSRCPSVCARKPPIGITCGGCVCPENKGFCDALGERSTVNSYSVYCMNELWLVQKSDNGGCQNNFECQSNFCSKGTCYDVRANVEKQGSVIDRILDWVRRFFGISV